MAQLQSTFITGSLMVSSSNLATGSTVLLVTGVNGELLSVDDSASGSLFSVSDISGLPILNVSSDDSVKLGKFGAEAVNIPPGGTDVVLSNNVYITSSGRVGIGVETPQTELHVAGTISSSYISASWAYTTASYAMMALVADYAAESASYAMTSSYASIAAYASAYSSESLYAYTAGTASYASAALYAKTASYIDGGVESASYATNALYAQYTLNSASAAQYADTASYATDGFFPYNGNRAIKRTAWPNGLNVGGTDLEQFVERVFFPFVPATISINSSTLNYETGSIQATLAVTGAITKNDETVFETGSVMVTAPTSRLIATLPTTAAYSVNDTNVQSNTTYRSYFRVGDTGGGNPGNIASANKVVNFNWPYIWGMLPTLTADPTTIYGLTKDVSSSSQTAGTNKVYSYVGDTVYLYFCYPSSFGDLTGIKDPNNLDAFGSFAQIKVQMTNASRGTTGWFTWVREYNVYRTKLASDPGGNFSFFFGTFVLVYRDLSEIGEE